MITGEWVCTSCPARFPSARGSLDSMQQHLRDRHGWAEQQLKDRWAIARAVRWSSTR